MSDPWENVLEECRRVAIKRREDTCAEVLRVANIYREKSEVHAKCGNHALSLILLNKATRIEEQVEKYAPEDGG